MRSLIRLFVVALMVGTVTLLGAPAFAQYDGYEVYERHEYYPPGAYGYDDGYYGGHRRYHPRPDYYDDGYYYDYGHPRGAVTLGIPLSVPLFHFDFGHGGHGRPGWGGGHRGGGGHGFGHDGSRGWRHGGHESGHHRLSHH